MGGPPPVPQLKEIACWRLVPAQRPTWQGGLLIHDGDLGGWSWDDGTAPDEADPDLPKAYWTPPAIDGHTHLGDAFLRPERDHLPRDLHALVAPPDGYKHQRLRQADHQTIVTGIGHRLAAMATLGTAHALDFREGGAEGAKQLLSAAQGTKVKVSAYARPAASTEDRDAWREELDALLDASIAGIGLSGVRDLPRTLLEYAAESCGAADARLAIHLAETRHEKMADALHLEPSILVHLVHSKVSELADAADAGVLAVTCPTSNRFFGMQAPVHALWEASKDHGLATAIGTDNAMLGDGDLKDEVAAAAEAAPEVDLDWLFRSLTWTPWKMMDLGPDPRAPGLLWGIHRKAPATHPEDTALGGASALFADGPFLAPKLR